jgi:PBP1b-binding outer membrane lipoprotein LpoB
LGGAERGVEMKRGILILAVLAITLLIVGCSSAAKPAISYERLDAPQAHFSIDYPSGWTQDNNGVLHGMIG